MPPRFVEVVEVGAEASETIAQLLAIGHGWVSGLSFDLSLYFNETTFDTLREKLAEYNITAAQIPEDWRLRFEDANFTLSEEYVPEGRARYYLAAGLSLIVARELVVRFLTRRKLKKFGMHQC